MAEEDEVPAGQHYSPKPDEPEETHAEEQKKDQEEDEEHAPDREVEFADPPEKTMKRPASAVKSKASPLKRPASHVQAVATAKAEAGAKAEALALAKPEELASSKAHAKGKPKPKPATKKAAAVSTTSKKRPAAKAETLPDPGKKKPKTKAEELKEKFKLPDVGGAEETVEGEEDEELEEDENTSRDRSKSNKFFSMMRSGGLPHAVLEAWQNADSREKQTALINQVFVKAGGKLVIKENFELPSSYRKDRVTERADTATDAQSGYGRTIFKRKMNLTDEDLDECVRTGEVRCFKSGDVWLYAAVNVQMTSGVSKKSVENLQGKEVALAPEAARAFANIFSSMEPEVNLQNNAAANQGSLPASGHGGAGPFLGFILAACMFQK